MGARDVHHDLLREVDLVFVRVQRYRDHLVSPRIVATYAPRYQSLKLLPLETNGNKHQ